MSAFGRTEALHAKTLSVLTVLRFMFDYGGHKKMAVFLFQPHHLI